MLTAKFQDKKGQKINFWPLIFKNLRIFILVVMVSRQTIADNDRPMAVIRKRRSFGK